MKNTKLVNVLKSLDNDEIRLFKRFLESKVFNKHKHVLALFGYINVQLKKETFKLDKTIVFQKSFPDIPYNDKMLRHVMSYLLKVLEKFLIYKELHRQDSTELIALSKSYRKRNLWKSLDSATKRASLAISRELKKDVDHHYQNYQLAQEIGIALTEKKRVTEINLQEITDRLDISYFANRLRQACSMLAHKNVYVADYDMGIIDVILKEVERKQFLDIPAISIYYYGYLALTEHENLSHFKKLQQELITHAYLFEQKEMRDMYLLAINIGIRFINQDKHEQMEETLELYKAGVEQRILFSNGRLSRFTYKNAAAIALQLNQFDWTEKFIKTYMEALDPSYREETYSYNLAKLHYYKKEYDKALKLLSITALSDDVYINLDTKIILAKVYFELGDLDAFEALLSNFQTFIRRKSVISYHRQNYQNFINCLKKLAAVNPYDKAAKRTLQKEFSDLNPLPEKYWFNVQLNKTY